MVDLVELAERTVKSVMNLGPSDCDVIVTDSTYYTAEIEKGSMKQSSAFKDPGVGVRAFVNGCAGFSSCTGHDLASIRKVAEQAVALAKSGTPDKDFKGLPLKAKPTKVAGLFEKRVAELEPADVVDMAISLAEGAGVDKRIHSVNATVSAGSGEVALANSNGFSGMQKLTSFEAIADTVAKSGSKMFSGVDVCWSRRIEPRALDAVANEAREHAIMGLRQTKVNTGEYPVIIDPLSVGFILGSTIGGGLNAESIQRKRSFLAGKLGETIGSEKLTIHDDPTLEWGNGSFAFDGEGVPARRKAIIDKGKLMTYLYDSYTAGKDAVSSTGNSSRGGAMWTFRRPPSISSSNIVVRKGDASIDEMIKDTRSGIYLRLTFDYPNLATGEFSGLMMESFKIEKGELGPSIRQSTMGISMLDMFSRIDMVGKKSREAFGVRTPAVRISRAKIGGSG
jgi:PmbA protein